jgi:TRAP-type transport system small permease protein
VQSQGILRSPVLGMSMALLYIPVLIGMISTVLRSLIAAADISLNGPVTATEGANTSDPKEVPAP